MPPELDSAQKKPGPIAEAAMGFFDHLIELRARLLYALGSILVCTFLTLYFWQEIYVFLSVPIEAAFAAAGLGDQKLIFIGPLEPIKFALQLGIYAGIFLSAPFIFWQVWLFVAPGLYRKEKHIALPFILFSTGLFLTGCWFAHSIILPITLKFLLSFGAENFDAYISIEKYFSLWLTMVLWMGLIFQMPVIIFLLSWIGIATPAFLLHYLRHAILLIAVVAAIVTPTTDPFTMAIFALPMVGLYLVGILVSAGVQWARRRKKRQREGEGVA